MKDNNDFVRIGKISSLNLKKATARVVYKDKDNAVTADLPFLASEYKMPKIDDLVLVLHLSSGMQNGVIIGKIYSDSFRPKKSGTEVYQKFFDSNASIETESGQIVLKAKNVTINAENLTFSTTKGTITMNEIYTAIKGGRQ